MMRTIAVVNQKGGCGKTTVSINLSATLAEMGKKVLLVDMDPQSHCAVGLAVPEEQTEQSIYDVLISSSRNEPMKLSEILWQIGDRLELAPASIDLSAFEQQMAGIPDRECCLKDVLAEVKNDYDYTVIDCPPAVGLLTFNALRAATDVIVPVETGYFSLHGLSKQLDTLKILCERCNQHVNVRVLASMYDIRTKMAREILAELRSHFSDKMFKQVVNFNTKIKEASSFGQPISEYDPSSKGHKDFRAIAEEIIASESKQQQRQIVNSLADQLEQISSSADQLMAEAQEQEKLQARAEKIEKQIAPEEVHKHKTKEKTEPQPVARTHETPEPAQQHSPEPVEEAIAEPAEGTTDEPVEFGESESGIDFEPETQTQAESFAEPVASKPEPAFGEQLNISPIEENSSAEQHEESTPQNLDDLNIESPEAASPKPSEPAQPKETAEDATAALEAKLADYYGVNQISDSVVFVTLYPRAQTVQVAGDFNNWQPAETGLKKVGETGVWQTKIKLPKGRYRYRLVVDGHWQQDPYNEMTEMNPFGGYNSVLEVK